MIMLSFCIQFILKIREPFSIWDIVCVTWNDSLQLFDSLLTICNELCSLSCLFNKWQEYGQN